MTKFKALSRILSVSIFCVGSSSIAVAQNQMSVPTDAQNQSVLPLKSKVTPKTKIMTTNCNTNQPGCEGQTTIGGFGYDVGCTIWWNNGASGQRNFRVSANTTVEEHVRYNDYGACIGWQYAPPKDQPRFPMHVHN